MNTRNFIHEEFAKPINKFFVIQSGALLFIVLLGFPIIVEGTEGSWDGYAVWISLAQAVKYCPGPALILVFSPILNGINYGRLLPVRRKNRYFILLAAIYFPCLILVTLVTMHAAESFTYQEITVPREAWRIPFCIYSHLFFCMASSNNVLKRKGERK